MDFHEYKKSVSRIFILFYGITLNDLSLKDEYLRECFDSGERPQNVVEYFGSKYDLERIRS